MRGFFRFLVGVTFIPLFILFLVITATKTTLLSSSYWKDSFLKSDLYPNISTNIQKLINTDQLDKLYLDSLTPEQLAKLTPAQKQQLQGKTVRETMPPETLEVFESIKQAKANITPQLVQETLETNIDRVLAYIKGKSEKLLLYVPMSKLQLPEAFLSQPPLDQLGPQTDAALLISSFTKEPEQILQMLEMAKKVGLFVTAVWAGLGIITLLTLVIHYFLGQGNRARARGTALLVAISGVLTALLAYLPRPILISGLSQSEGVPPFLLDLIPNLVGGFMQTGLIIGLISLVVGIAGFVVASKMLEPETKPVKKADDQKGGKAKYIIIGIVILLFLGIVLGIIGSLSGKKSAKKTTTELVGGVYVSEKLGWQITPPANWPARESDNAVGFIKTVPESMRKDPTILALVSVEPSTRPPAENITQAFDYITKFFDTNNSNDTRFKNAVLDNTNSFFDQWHGFDRLVFLFDYDSPAGEGKTRVREVRWYLFPQGSTEDGFLLIGQATIEGWANHEATITQALGTFEELK